MGCDDSKVALDLNGNSDDIMLQESTLGIEPISDAEENLKDSADSCSEEYIVDADSDCGEMNEFSKLHFNYALVDFEILMESILLCRKCCSTKVTCEQRSLVGASISMILICENCSNRWKWFSSKQHSVGKLVNSDISAASTLCGLSYTTLQQFFECIRMPHLSERAHHNIVNKRIAPAVNDSFEKMQREVLDLVLQQSEMSGTINLAGDAMYDSPGFCALFCRYALLDVKSGLVVEVESSRKERNESSKAQEPKTLEVALRRFKQKVDASKKPVKIDSITTDRDASVKKMLSQKFLGLKTWSDCWHFAKNIQKSLCQKKDQIQMIPVKNWINALSNHLFHSVSSSNGDGELVVEKFFSFFLHIQNIHRNFKNIGSFKFTRFKQWQHGVLKNSKNYLDLAIPSHKKAFDILFELTATSKRLEDLKSVSPHWATSQVESFNSVSILYHPKCRFYSRKGFALRSKLSVLHWNSLKMSQMEGIRKKKGVKSRYSKSHRKVVWKDVFTKNSNSWRTEIFEKIQKDVKTAVSLIADDEEDDIDLEETDMLNGEECTEFERDYIELEEAAINMFGLEIERVESDEENDSDEDNEKVEKDQEKGKWRDVGDLEINLDEQKSLMNDYSALLVDKTQIMPKTNDSLSHFPPTFSFGTRCHENIQKMFKSTKFRGYCGTSVSEDEESDDCEE